MTTTTNSMANFINECNISFTGGDLSSDTGLMLLLDFLENSSFLMPYKDLPYEDSRSQILPHNSNHSIFVQQIVRFLAGYSSQADQAVLRNDPLLSMYFEQVSSQSSVSRFFSRISENTLNALWEVFVRQSCSVIDGRCDDILLDADSTKTDTYGLQEGSAWIHHYSQVGYHPFVVNEYTTKLLAGAWLRTGDTYSADESCSLLENILSQFTDKEGRTIRFRGDAAFYNHELMELFERWSSPVLYAIRAKGTGRLNDACADSYYAQEHEEDCTYSQSSPFYSEIRYQMTGSECGRRVCFKLWFSEDEDKNGQICLIPHVFAVITNIEDMSPEQVIAFYCQRGASENFTKELKDDFHANTLSHKSFSANAFEFLMKAIAYNVFHLFQILILEGNDQKMQASTFRKCYQKVAGRLSRHARELHLRIAGSFRYKEQFMRYLRKVRRIKPLNG